MFELPLSTCIFLLQHRRLFMKAFSEQFAILFSYIV